MGWVFFPEAVIVWANLFTYIPTNTNFQVLIVNSGLERVKLSIHIYFYNFTLCFCFYKKWCELAGGESNGRLYLFFQIYPPVHTRNYVISLHWSTRFLLPFQSRCLLIFYLLKLLQITNISTNLSPTLPNSDKWQTESTRTTRPYQEPTKPPPRPLRRRSNPPRRTPISRSLRPGPTSSTFPRTKSTASPHRRTLAASRASLAAKATAAPAASASAGSSASSSFSSSSSALPPASSTSSSSPNRPTTPSTPSP